MMRRTLNLQANSIAERERFRDGYTIGHQHDSDNDSGRALALQQFQVSGMGQDLIWNYSRKTGIGLDFWHARSGAARRKPLWDNDLRQLIACQTHTKFLIETVSQ